MSDASNIYKKSFLTPRSMLLGGLVGALVGMLVRGGFTFFNVFILAELGAGGLSVLASLPSAGIGFLCGAISGCLCREWIGAILGAFLSAGVFALFVAPFAYVAALFNAEHQLVEFTLPYFGQKALAGALAGGVGGLVGRLILAAENREHAVKKEVPPVPEMDVTEVNDTPPGGNKLGGGFQ